MEKTTNTELVIFDLDGTLLDTIGDLAVACNACLAVRGLPQHSYEDYCGFVGNGIMRLVERALPEPLRTPENVALVRADFVAYYTAHIDAFTKPYAGIPELLAALTARGVRTAVASNKFQAGTEKLVTPPATGTAPGRVLYVGDSGIDMQTAAAAGVRSAGVTWGFRSREELVQAGAQHLVDRPDELLALL